MDEFEAGYMKKLRAFLVAERQARKVIYPKGDKIFAALDATPLDGVKVVIIGQDPYHGPNQAHGLCFSVLPGVTAPPSLVNIFQEINTDMADENVPFGRHDGAIPAGRVCLEPWARQGVLLLNAVLTVAAGRAGSHQGQRLGDLYGPRGRDHQPAAGACRLHALGQLCAEEGRGRRRPPPPRAQRTAPVAAVGASGLLRLPAFLPGQPVPG